MLWPILHICYFVIFVVVVIALSICKPLCWFFFGFFCLSTLAILDEMKVSLDLYICHFNIMICVCEHLSIDSTQPHTHTDILSARLFIHSLAQIK